MSFGYEMEAEQLWARVDAKTGNAIRRHRVFLADDHEEMLRTAALILAKEFHVVGMAADAHSVLRLAPALMPDVLVMDICMPMMNGIDAAVRLKSFGCQMKFVFLTVTPDIDFLEAALETGVVGYVLKPYLCTELIPAIRMVLGGKRFISSCMHRQ